MSPYYFPFGISRSPQNTLRNTITLTQAGIVGLTIVLAVAGQVGWRIEYPAGTLRSQCTASGCQIYGPLSVSGTTQFNDISYTWPSADGSSNQRLTTDGAGTLSWATVTGGGGGGGGLTGTGNLNSVTYWQTISSLSGTYIRMAGLRTMSGGNFFGNSLSGGTLFGKTSITSSGTLIAEGTATFQGTVTMGAQIDDTELTAEDFGDFTCTGSEDACTVDANAIALSTDTTGNYVLDVADGTGIDGTAAAEGATYTPTLDLTEITCGVGISCSAATTISFVSTEVDATTWSNGAQSSNAWTFDLSGADHTMTAQSNGMRFGADLEVVNTLSGANVYLGSTASGAGLAACSANNKDRVQWDATTERFSCDTDDIALTTDTSGNYAAGDAEAGNALTGDSATAFFSAGQIELARGGTNASLTAAAGAIVYSTSSAFALNSVTGASSGMSLIYQGPSAAPKWGSGALRDAIGIGGVGLSGAGVQTGTGGTTPIIMPYSFYIEDIMLTINEAPYGQAVQVDILEDNVALLSTDAEIDAGSNNDDNNHVFSDRKIDVNDRISFKIIQTGTDAGGHGSGLTILLKGYKYP